jgi:sphinganine-1-phosphate aldolase
MDYLSRMRSKETKLAEAKAMGGIYSDPYIKSSKALKDMQADAWRLYSASNALYPDVFPSVRKMEAEIIAMTLDFCSAKSADHCGLLTSGGTESILLAAKAYRDLFLSKRWRLCGSSDPVEVVAGITRHPALDKAVRCFGMRLVLVPVDASTGFRMRPSDVASAITSNTAFVYASAPTFPHGKVDPVHELAPLCAARGVGLHVDNCLGGMLMSGMREAGLEVPPFDFAVEGVTSMSVDLHKYGLAAKGASSVLFSSKALRSHTFVPVADFPGGFYVTPTLQGSRSGANMAQTWATLMHLGKPGYAALAKDIHELVVRFKEGVKRIEGLELLVEPDCSVVAFTSKAFCVYALVERMGKLHDWAFITLQRPKAAQLCLMQGHARSLDRMLSDLAKEAEWMRAHPDTKATGIAGAYSVVEGLPPSAVFGTLKGYQDLALQVVPSTATAPAPVE